MPAGAPDASIQVGTWLWVPCAAEGWLAVRATETFAIPPRSAGSATSGGGGGGGGRARAGSAAERAANDAPLASATAESGAACTITVGQARACRRLVGDAPTSGGGGGGGGAVVSCGLEDMVRLHDLSEAPLLHNLRRRFSVDLVCVSRAVIPIRSTRIRSIDDRDKSL